MFRVKLHCKISKRMEKCFRIFCSLWTQEVFLLQWRARSTAPCYMRLRLDPWDKRKTGYIQLNLPWCGGCAAQNQKTESQQAPLGQTLEASPPPITNQVRRSRLRSFGHMERRDEDEWLRKAWNLDIGGKVPTGRSRQTWAQTVKADLKDQKDMAQDCKLLRAVILAESDSLKVVFDYKWW